MKFAYSWLREWIDPGLTAPALAERLTMAGIEVEQLAAGAPFTGVVVARVLSVTAHPQADRLKVCSVDVGEATPRQIVCGAPDVAPGLLTACALPGAELPGKTITEASVRGVASSGMLCSAQELGVSADGEGLLQVAPGNAPGAALDAVLGLNETVFTLKLTPNRGDCLSIAGLAREVAAITGIELRAPVAASVAVANAQQRGIHLVAPACPRYCGRVIEGVRGDAATPEYIARRLASAGVRCHDAIVDITNYVMLELGQPLHAFDNDKLDGDIEVRTAQNGEKLRVLNGDELGLDQGELLICDARGPVALAGVMGGADSAVGPSTRNIFLESAFFEPAAIAGVARRFGLTSDAAYRFERGVDFTATRAALERASALILEICGGQAGPISEASASLPARAPIALPAAAVKRLLGIDLDRQTVEQLLRRTGASVESSQAGFLVTPPSYRFDLSIEADLIEEIARLYGYEQIPAEAPRAPLQMLGAPEARRSALELAERLCARDYQEIVTYSFVDAELERDLGSATPIALMNPIASQLGVMRTSLLPGLVAAARFNLDRQATRIRLFEIGRCFVAASGEMSQPWRVGGICLGPAQPEQWGIPTRAVDFFDLKGDLEALLGTDVEWHPLDSPALHPGQSARIVVDGKEIGWAGTLHPRWQQKYGTKAAVAFELGRDALLDRALPQYSELSRFPEVIRDIACVVEEKHGYGAILDALRRAAPAIVKELTLFDIYRGKGIDLGKKSLAFRVLMQDTRKTLAEDEIVAAIDLLIGKLESDFGATLRLQEHQ